MDNKYYQKKKPKKFEEGQRKYARYENNIDAHRNPLYNIETPSSK
jgi:hypothetical protein